MLTSQQLIKHTISSSTYLVNPGWFSPTEQSFFSMSEGPVEYSASPSPSGSLFGYLVYAPKETVQHGREIYNFLDLLGDVGGLFDGLKLIGAGIVSVLSAGGLQLKLVGNLFFRAPTHAK